MAPACVLLERFVKFVDKTVLVEESVTGDGDAEELLSWEETESPSWEEIDEGIAAYLRAMKPDPCVVDPPMLHSGFIAAAHHNLVVIYAGPYRPANSSDGCYLLYAAAKSSSDSLSTIPGIPYSASYSSVGNGTIIMAGADGSFVLAELLTKFGSEPPQAMLCLWSQGAQCWEHKSGLLPADVCPPKYLFSAHMAFSLNTILCWVDLFYGLLLCDMERHSLADFCFVPLPPGHAMDTPRKAADRRLCAQEFRSMACVASTIKYITMDGYLEGSRPDNQVRLTTWTLDMQDRSWTEDTALCLEELWADDSFLSRGLPQIKPSFPVLSTQQHDIVYLLLPGVETVDGYQVRRVQHLLSVDTRRKKVLSSTKYNNNATFLWPNLCATNFNVYLQGSKDHQYVEASGKRMKL